MAFTTVVAVASLVQSANDGDLDAIKVVAAIAALALIGGAGQLATRPVGVVLGIAAAASTAAMTGFNGDSIGWFVLVMLACQVSATMTLRAGFAVYLGILAAVACIADQGTLPWFIGTSFGFWGGWAARARIELLDSERTVALSDERRRIAHDLHDVVAHTLAVTVLHLGGARLAVEHEPEEAAKAIAEAERLARESMAQLRSIVEVLADDSPDGRRAPQPAASELTALIDEYRDAGLPLGASITGDLAKVPAPHGVVLYRIAQEALANAARHAPGQTVSVSIDVLDSGGAHLLVRNPIISSRADNGIGITAMIDRARAVGGTLTAGPRDGAWVVEASV